MKRKKFVIVALIFAAGVALGVASANFMINPAVLDQGGGYANSSNFEQRGSIGGMAVGSAASTNFKMDVGYIAVSGGGGSAAWIQITQLPTPDTIGLGGTSQIKWVSALAGTYYIERGGSGIPGSGVQIATGSCLAATEVTNNILESSLTPNASNTLYIIVDAGSVGSQQVAIVSDRISPVLTPTQVTIAGTCDDATVTNVLVNGSSVVVTAGAYNAVVTTSLDTIIVSATNGATQTVTRTVTLTQP